jgi:hypothetical protein
MNQSEKETFLVRVQEIETKLRELKSWVAALDIREVPLFGHVEDNPILQPETEEEPKTTTVAAPRRTREWVDDGTLNASSIARKLSKELGTTISRDVVIKVGKAMKVKPTYYKRQHISRYSPEDVKKIMDVFRAQFQSVQQ